MAFNASQAEDFLLTSDRVIADLCKHSEQLKNLSNYSDIENSTKTLVQNALGLPSEVEFYGSRVIGVASTESDLDIFLNIDDTTYQMYVQNDEHDDRFKKVAQEIRKSEKWQLKELIVNTPVPVIVATYRPMELDCDINIMNAFGPANTKLMAHLFEIQPEAVSLLHFVRQWLISQDFNRFQGYSLTLLVIFYLQSKKLMPSGDAVKREVSPKIIINDCECQFDKSRSREFYGCSKVDDYKNHLQGFFKFYAEFDFSKVMSTVCGSAVTQRDYSARFPKFAMEGILIAGLCNERKNCGVCDENTKRDFISLCTATAEFLHSNGLELETRLLCP